MRQQIALSSAESVRFRRDPPQEVDGRADLAVTAELWVRNQEHVVFTRIVRYGDQTIVRMRVWSW
jgi:hypothetical protein